MPFGIGNRRRNAAARAHETDALLAREVPRASEVPRAEHPTDSRSTPDRPRGRSPGVALGRAFALLACAACGVCAYSYNTAPYALIATLERFALGTHTRSITFRVYTCGIPDAVYDEARAVAGVPRPARRMPGRRRDVRILAVREGHRDDADDGKSKRVRGDDGSIRHGRRLRLRRRRGGMQRGGRDELRKRTRRGLQG